MTHKTQQKFSVLEFDAEKLKRLSDSEAALLSLATFLMNEIYTFSRVYQCGAHEFEDNNLVDLAAVSQRAVIMRIWSAKLYEFYALLKSAEKSENKYSKEIAEQISAAKQAIKKLDEDGAWSIVSTLRNEVTYHLEEKAVRKNLNHLTPGADLNFYINARDANSLFFLGEEVVFNARLNLNSNRPVTLEERSKTLRKWSKWNEGATQIAKAFHWRLVRLLIISQSEERLPNTVFVEMSSEKVGDVTKAKIPLFDGDA